MPKLPSKPAKNVRVKLAPTDVAKAIAKGVQAIDSGQLLNALIQRWGGPSQFAADIFTEFQGAKQGSLTRQRILEMIARLTVQVTSQEIAKPKPVSDLTDAELLVTARNILEKLNGPGTARPTEAEAGQAG